MLFLSNIDILILTLIAITTWYFRGYMQERRENPNNLPLPPGPRGFPIIGSLFAFPRHKAWVEYDKWFKIYGDMVYFKVFGHGFLILGSLKRAYDIFERRSSNYSGRPRMVMLNELMDMTYVFAFQPYGAWWRRHRRGFHEHFHPNMIHNYRPIHLETSRKFICRLLESPEKFLYHTRFAFADSILKTSYGIGAEEDASYIGHGEAVLAGLAAAGHPGAFLVDIFPFMKIFPEWFPGAGWKRKAKAWRYVNEIVANSLWDTVKKRVEAGKATPCVATTLLETMPDDGSPESKEEEIVRRNICAVSFVGGSDTVRITSELSRSFLSNSNGPPEIGVDASVDRGSTDFYIKQCRHQHLC